MKSPSAAWFTARPLDSYPPGDDEVHVEDSSEFHGAPSWMERVLAPEGVIVSLSRLRYLRILAGVTAALVFICFMFTSVLRDALLRWEGVPPGLWSDDGVLKVGKTPFHLKGISWYGFEGPTNCLEGLDKNSLDNILDIVARHNFNALRIPLALDKWSTNPPIGTKSISSFANPELKRLPYRELIRVVVERAASKNILVLLDMHRLDASVWPSDGKWFSEAVSAESLITVWEELAQEFGSQWNVVGADIFNEPYGAEDWASWRAFVELAGNRILDFAPRWVIVAEGVGNLLDSPRPEPVFWAENLAPSIEDPPVLSNPKKLVLSPHVYGPSVHNHSYFNAKSFPENMPAIWDDHFGNAADAGFALVVGEFGGRNVGLDYQWHRKFLSYLTAKSFGHFYWCLNPSSQDTGGFLSDDWSTVEERKVDVLSRAKFTPVQSHLRAFKRRY